MEEEALLKKRFLDLSRQADYKGIVTFTDFLNLNELNIFHQTSTLLATGYEINGGYELAERQMVAFLPDALYYEWSYPFVCIQIAPAYPKFQDTLNHRDILGALMNLGILRSKIGDIILKDNIAYVFCAEAVSSYLAESLEKVKHTIVKSAVVDAFNLSVTPNFEATGGIVTSNRLDAIVACITKVSRSNASAMIANGKVFINGKETLHNTYVCKQKDILSIRFYGKYIFDEISGETKKGRLKISYRKYV